jgi:hypothetical protein
MSEKKEHMFHSAYSFILSSIIIYSISYRVAQSKNAQAIYPIHGNVVQVPAPNAIYLRTCRPSVDDAARIASEDSIPPFIRLSADRASHDVKKVIDLMAPVSRATIVAAIARVIVPQVDVHIVVSLIAPGREVDLVKC